MPTAYFATTGTGQSDDGIPPDPYETFSYDLALLDAGIQDFNVVYYTSVIPLEANEFHPTKEYEEEYFHHGAVLETIMAKAGGVKGDTAVAGVGRVWAKDFGGKPVGGYAAEYEFVYNSEIDAKTAENNAIAQLTKSLDHILEIRGLTQVGDKEFTTTSIYIEKNYGMALAALGFVNFDYPDPLPVPPEGE
ncbi:MAG: pyruvoyl-dependent arginine decarboxylase [bacterium]|nr:pyruvoyl-dependent arginine decarboxylase [bacterium]